MFDKCREITEKPPISLIGALEEFKEYRDSTRTCHLLSTALTILNEEGILPLFQNFPTKRSLNYTPSREVGASLDLDYERTLDFEDFLKRTRHEEITITSCLREPWFSVSFDLDVYLTGLGLQRVRKLKRATYNEINSELQLNF